MAQRFTIDSVFRAIDQITNPTRKMAASIGRSADRMARKLNKVNKVFARIKSGAAGIGRAGFVAGAVVAGALTHAAKVGADFEQTLIRAGAKFDGIKRGTKDFEALGDAAIAVSSKTEFMGTAAAGALEFMATANEEAAVATGVLANFADFATANTVDLARAADISSDSIALLGLNLDSLGKKIVDPTEKIAAYAEVNDLLTATATGANLTLDQVFETVKKASGVFRAAGQPIDVFLAAVQEVSVVLKGAEAGTGLRIVMKNLLATTGEAGKVMKKLKIAVIDVKTGKIRDLPDILEDVKKKLDKFSEGKRKRTLSLLFGEGEQAALALLDGVESLRTRIGVMADESTGKVDKLATTMRDSALAEFKTFGSTIEAIEIEVFQIIRDDVVKITKAVTEWARANKDAFGEKVSATLQFMRDNFDDVVKMAPRMLIFVGTLVALAKILATIEVLVTVLAAVTTFTAGTVGLLAVAIVALIVVLGLMIFFWDDILEAMETVWGFMVNVFVEAIEVLVETWESLMKGVEAGKVIWEALIDALADLIEIIVGVVESSTLLTDAGALLEESWDGIAEFFSGMWGEIVDSFFQSMLAITDKLDSMKKTFNEFVGSDVFDVEVKGRVQFEPIEDPSFGAVAPANDFGAPANDFGQRGGEALGFGGGALGGASGPQVINTSSETLSRTVQESMAAVQVDVNVRAPPGVVESVERKGASGVVKVSRTGDL